MVRPDSCLLSPASGEDRLVFVDDLQAFDLGSCQIDALFVEVRERYQHIHESALRLLVIRVEDEITS